MHWMSVKLGDNFQFREHSWPCLFHITYLDGNPGLGLENAHIKGNSGKLGSQIYSFSNKTSSVSHH
jgi:hypothetical protein